jgi:hypothetical protein
MAADPNKAAFALTLANPYIPSFLTASLPMILTNIIVRTTLWL